MDARVMLNIAQLSDSVTAMNILKAGGSDFFQAATTLRIINNIPIEHEYFELSFRFMSDEYRIYKFPDLCDAFEVNTFMHCVCNECIFKFCEYKTAMKNGTHTPNACHVFMNRTNNIVDIVSTNAHAMFRGLLKLEQMSQRSQVKITTHLTIHVPVTAPGKFNNVTYMGQIIPIKYLDPNTNTAKLDIKHVLDAIKRYNASTANMTLASTSNLLISTRQHTFGSLERFLLI